MKIKPFSFVVFSLLIIFAVVSFGGCGGSSNSFSGGNNNERGGGVTGAEYYVLDFENPDTDGDGIPDVLDFGDIEEKYYGKDDIITDRKISVPSRHYLGRFKRAVESPDSFVVDLTAGTEYTVEISKGTQYEFPIAESVPNVEIINPQGNALSFLDLGSFDENYDSEAIIDLSDDVIELSVYPPEEPYTICLTFTPAATGSYKINLNQVISDDGDYDNVKTLFVYKELRNDDTDEAGYYKRFKFQDEDGNVSETISMTDITELRKAYNVTLSNLVRTYMEYVISGDIEWNDNDFVQINEYGLDVYASVLSDIRKQYGFFDDESDDEEAEEDETDTEVSSSAAKKNADGTSIPSELLGIPYEDMFQLGAGFFGITGVKSQGDAIKEFNLAVPKTKNVKAFYTAKFISSQQEREALSKTNANASVAIGGFGVNAGYSSGSSFKFGLTSTTLVIHYEEAEVKYRYLNTSNYQLKDAAKTLLAKGSSGFRNEYGDYFVAGYKYGGTYDAFISITTDTTEQLEEVKMHLAANYNSVGKAASADISNETKDFLKKRNALVTVEIRTAGIDTDGNASKVTTHDNVDDGIGGVASQLEDFRAKLKKSKPSDYMPCYVMLKRYRSLDPVLLQMEKDNESGLLPIKAAHSKKILQFNKVFMTLQSYYNVIRDLDALKIDQEVKNQLGDEYYDIAAEVQAYGNSFYMESNAKNMEAARKKIVNMSSRVKALGDRYAFYRVLMGFQAKEKAYKPSVVTDKPYGPNGGSIGTKSYNVSTAVTSDLNAGKQHTKEIEQYSGREWNIDDLDAGEGYIFCHIRIVANNTHDDERTAYYPTIATRKPTYFFKSGAARWNEWKFILQSMRFTKELYPFLGLD